MSFFVNAGLRLVTEVCKMRAFVELWDELCLDRYGVEDEKLRRFRYGVQVNSLGLTEQQPENNVYRILIEMLAVVLSKKARARAVQLPAWNEAFGLPRPWDQQWSLRMQQIVAFETDLLEFEDIFDGSKAVAEKVEALKREARDELGLVLELGGAVRAVELRLHETQAGGGECGAHRGHRNQGRPRWSGSTPIPTASSRRWRRGAARRSWRSPTTSTASRSSASGRGVRAATAARRGRRSRNCGGPRRRERNIMEPSIGCAKAGVTTGEWGATLRSVFGEYRAPTGVSLSAADDRSPTLAPLRSRVEALSARLGTPVRFLIGKPGLDGHSNGAEQIALRASAAGLEVVYDGIRHHAGRDRPDRQRSAASISSGCPSCPARTSPWCATS